MQLLESMISLFFFVLIVSLLIVPSQYSDYLDASRYRVQVAEDIWRVLELKGAFDFRKLDGSGFGCSSYGSCDTLQRIQDATGYCIYISGTKYAGDYSMNSFGCSQSDGWSYTTQRMVVVVENGEPKIERVTYRVVKPFG